MGAGDSNEIARLSQAVSDLTSAIKDLKQDFKQTMSTCADCRATQAQHTVEIEANSKDCSIAHSRITAVSNRQWAFVTAVVLMVIAGVVKAGTTKGGPDLDNTIITQLLSGDWQTILQYIGVAILNIGLVAGARSWAMAKGKEFLSSGRAAWIFVFIVCLLEKLFTAHFGQLADPAGLITAIQASIADASAATVGVLAVHTTGKTAIQGVLRAATVSQPNIPCGNSSGVLMQSASLNLPVDAGTIMDVLNALDPETREKLLIKLGSVDPTTSKYTVRQWLYEAIDQIPVRWGKLGAFLFRLLVAPRLYKIVDKYISDMERSGYTLGIELSQCLGGPSLAV